MLDTGKTLGLKCTAPDTFEAVTKVAADDCNEPKICALADAPAPPADGGLDCSYADTKEFEEFTCACSDVTLTPAGGTGHPQCAFTGVWQAPGTWHTCAAADTNTDTSGTDTGGTDTGGTETSGTDTSGTDGKRRRRDVESEYFDLDDEEIDLYDSLHARSKRAASANYIKVDTIK